jgi:hypothetical protein
MSDIRCAKCGEPWDAYGVREATDMEPTEAKRFLRGEGCPSCAWGECCPLCSGTGKDGEASRCRTCSPMRPGVMRVWSPDRSARGFEAGLWYSGWSPNVRCEGPNPAGLRASGAFLSAEGRVRDATATCPDCDPSTLPACVQCGGSGKLTVPELLDIEAAQDECEASDEDPMLILQRRRLIQSTRGAAQTAPLSMG